MTAFLEVLNDLFYFVVGRDEKNETLRIKRVEVNSESQVQQNSSVQEEGKIFQNRQTIPGLILTDYSQKQYVTRSDTKVWQSPYISFDGVVGYLSFSDVVMTGRQKGRFVQVVDDGREGWVMAEKLTDDANKINPTFLAGKVYVSDSKETKLVRRYIKDEFSGSELLLPLQAEEYIAFKVRQSGARFFWGKLRPRLAGNWQNILKGSRGVSIGISPKTGSIMEWSKDGKGYLLYVEKVSPEEDLEVSGVDYQEEGVFSCVNLKKKEWIELRPVFISIS